MLHPGQLEPPLQGQHRAPPVGRHLPGGRGRPRPHRAGPREGPVGRREADAAALPPDPRLRACARLQLRRAQGDSPGRRGARRLLTDGSPRPGDRMAERVGVIVPAAGTGRRLGTRSGKALVELAACPLLAWAVAAVEANDRVDSVVVVAHPAALGPVTELLAAHGSAKVAAVVAGGPTRRASVAAGLAALPPGPGYVAVHDACRPLLAPGAIDRLTETLLALGCHGVAPGAQVTDTVRRVASGGRSAGIVDREALRALQTPQVFVRVALEEAHRRAAAGGLGEGPGVTDEATDAVLVERAGFPVAVVPGEPENLTVTTPLDLEVAEVLLSRRARGQVAR